MTENTSPDIPPTSHLHLGAAYYPEHWPEERWPEDIRLMQEAGFTVARMGEFAWSTFEPAEGEFNFAWLDRAIDMLAEAGIVSVLGTPTAAPPAWLTHAHPNTLAVDEYGRRAQHGNRCHYCVNSTGYHDATRRLVTAMAEHFGPNPNVIGWQIDNEFSRTCCCDHCRARFQAYLAERFDRGYEAYPECREHIDKPPSEYLKNFYYDTVNFDVRALQFAIDFAGAKQLIAGSDYPHQIGSLEKMISSINQLEITAEEKAGILGENAIRLLGL
jgi:hypothetical protein